MVLLPITLWVKTLSRKYFRSFGQINGKLESILLLKPTYTAQFRNTALNYIKHQKVKRQYEQINNDESIYTEKSQEEHLIGKELNAKIQSAINNLPTERRKIFLMSRMDELKYKEIAERLDISIKNC